MEFRQLRPEELDAWAAHCGTVFSEAGHGVDKAFFLRHFHNDPWRDVNGIFVAEDGGRIVSTVRVFRRKAWLLGAEVPMGGIGEVSTNPDYRGQGLAGTLLNLSIEWMRREGLAVSLLFSMAYDFYGRFGWKAIPKPMKRFEKAADLPCEGRALTPEDLTSLIAVEAASKKTDWMVVRDEPEYWRRWIAPSLSKGVVAVQDGVIVAWMAYALDKDSWYVHEFRAQPGFEHKFDGLCALAAALEGRRAQPFSAPAWLPTGTVESERFSLMYSMVRLIIPFAASGREIGSTERLIAEAGECRDSGLDHY